MPLEEGEPISLAYPAGLSRVAAPPSTGVNPIHPSVALCCQLRAPSVTAPAAPSSPTFRQATLVLPNPPGTPPRYAHLACAPDWKMACTSFVGLAMQAIFTAGRLAPHAGFRLVDVRLAFLSQNRPFLRHSFDPVQKVPFP